MFDEAWVEEQERLQLSLDIEMLEPSVAGLFRDGRPQRHQWLRVIGRGRDPLSGAEYYLLQEGGSGASFWPVAQVELFPNEPPP